MGKLDKFKSEKNTLLTTTPIATQSPLNRGTRNTATTKVPLSRGQSVSSGGCFDQDERSDGIVSNTSNLLPEVIAPFQRTHYNPKLQERSKVMSRGMTKAERKIWFEVLSEKKLLGYKFVKQKIVFNYILDFYCTELSLAVEIDGESHDQKQEYDKVREDFLRSCRITVLRFTNEEVIENLDGVRESLVRWVDKNARLQ